MKTKELTIEEKAKAYDRAIANAKEQAIDGYLDAVAVNDIFPELKEGEGEQHRKWILEYLYDGLRKSDEQFKDHFKTAIDWLEKQGEQKPAEWSKEDERNFDIIYGIIYNSCIAEDASRLNAWLKSLRPRKQWKPSEEEMKALEFCLEYNIDKDGVFGSKVVKLYDELKKLREE